MTKPEEQSSSSKDIKLPFDFSRIKYPAFWAGMLILIAAIMRSVLASNFGQIGEDADDVMRLVQIKDYLAGQSWFHTDQYRLGLAGGTDMHWSRIPDIPVILLTKLFDIFMAQDTALIWAISIWPPIAAGLFIYAMTQAARFWGGSKTQAFMLVLLALFIYRFQRFAPGGIDHHNIQIALIAISMGFALDPKMRKRSYIISGFAAAISIAIGVDVYLFVAAISLFVAVNWAVMGASAGPVAQAYGLAMSGGLALAFFGTIAPSEYGLIYCDALSLATVSAGVAGALGLAVAARFFSKKNKLLRFSCLAAIGAICLVILGLQAPQCLANPLDALPLDVVTLWLNDIQEAKPLFSENRDILSEVPFMIGAPVLALIVLIFSLVKTREWSSKYLVLLLLITALGLTFYQIRFHSFAYIFALLPLAAWIGKVYEAGRKSGQNNLLYLACLVASIPVIWGTPGLFFEDAGTAKTELETSEASGLCYSQDVISLLNTLPAGLISAGSNGAGDILNQTQHRTLSGNYHRNWDGILAQIYIATSPPDKAFALLSKHRVNYVHYCAGGSGTKTYVNGYENSLYANIKAGALPDYLEPVSDNLEDGNVKIFRIKLPD